MTDTQKMQFNHMREALRRIATAYQTPAQLRRNAGKEYGLEYEAALEAAYENIQIEAKVTVKGVKAV